MDVQLQSILIHTYHHDLDLRSQAEAALVQFLNAPGFLIAFVQLLSNVSLPRDLRQAAGIVLKNKMRDISLTLRGY